MALLVGDGEGSAFTCAGDACLATTGATLLDKSRLSDRGSITSRRTVKLASVSSEGLGETGFGSEHALQAIILAKLK